MVHTWPLTLRDRELVLRPLQRRDRAAYDALRRRNAAWLRPWDATDPEHGRVQPPFATLRRWGERQARAGTMLPLGIVVDGRLRGQITAHIGEMMEALEDHDVRGRHHDLLVREDVVGDVRVLGRTDLDGAGLDLGHEAQQGPAVVGLREALAAAEPAALELCVGEQEAVGRDLLRANISAKH